MQEAGDFSDESVAEAKARVAEAENKILEEHQGTSNSRLRLRGQLEKRRLAFEDSINIDRLSQEDARLKARVGAKLNETVSDVFSDPNVVLEGATPMSVLAPHFENMRSKLEFLGLSDTQVESFMPVAEDEIARSIFSPLIAQGQFDRAEDFLQHPELAEVLQPVTRREIANRIAVGRQQLTENQNKGVEYLQTARAILGPGATEMQVRGAAAKMAGIISTSGGEFQIVNVGNDAVVFNKGTGEIVQRLEGGGEEAAELSDVAVYRKEFTSLSDDFIKVRDAYGKIRQIAANPSGIGDIALMTAFAKMIDPGGRVTEADVVIQSQAGSFGERMRVAAETLLAGDQLSNTQRADIIKNAHGTFAAQLNEQERIAREWRSLGQQYYSNFDPMFVVPDYIGPTRHWEPIDIEETEKGKKGPPLERLGKEIDEFRDYLTGSEPRDIPSERLVPEESIEGSLEEAEQGLGAVVDFFPSIEELTVMTKEQATSLIENLDPTIEELRQIRKSMPELWDTLKKKLGMEEETE